MLIDDNYRYQRLKRDQRPCMAYLIQVLSVLSRPWAMSDVDITQLKLNFITE